MDLTDAQWAFLEPQFRPKRRRDGRGRPWQDTRAVLNGVLWVLRTGAPWHDLPHRYPPYQTCHQRFQQWRRSGLFERLLQTLAEDLRDRGKLDLSEAFIDASLSSAKKGTQDGRVLRRYRRRWKIERLFAWLHNYRRIVIRREYYPENFLGMVQLACAVILLRHL